MSEYSDAKLVLIPNGRKEGKLFSLKPTNGSGDFTVVRDSPVYDYVNGNLEITPNNVPFFKKVDGCSVLTTQRQSTNIYLNNPVMVTQNVTTTASTYTVSFWGTGSINFTGSYVGSLVGTGDFERVELTFVAVSGTLTSNVTGAVVYGQCEEFDYATSIIVTGGTPVTRLADDITVAPPVGVTEIIETINGVEQPPITVIPEIYQVPVYDLGEELVVNGGFDSADNWVISNEDATHIITIENSSLRFESDTTSPPLNIYQLDVLEVGKKYELTINVSNIESGLLKTDVFGNNDVISNSTGNNIIIGVATSTTLNITRSTANVDVSIDNVSIKEILPNKVNINKIIMQ